MTKNNHVSKIWTRDQNSLAWSKTNHVTRNQSRDSKSVMRTKSNHLTQKLVTSTKINHVTKNQLRDQKAINVTKSQSFDHTGDQKTSHVTETDHPKPDTGHVTKRQKPDPWLKISHVIRNLSRDQKLITRPKISHVTKSQLSWPNFVSYWLSNGLLDS